MAELAAIVDASLSVGQLMTIVAVAGAGKSFALREYARARTSQTFLFVSFNSAVRKEKADEFARAGLRNVVVHTLHSFAYETIIKTSLPTQSLLAERAGALLAKLTKQSCSLGVVRNPVQ